MLAKVTALGPQLDELVASGALGGYDHAARYLPTIERQERRRAALPSDARSCALRCLAALQATPFKPGVFEPFLDGRRTSP